MASTTGRGSASRPAIRTAIPHRVSPGATTYGRTPSRRGLASAEPPPAWAAPPAAPTATAAAAARPTILPHRTRVRAMSVSIANARSMSKGFTEHMFDRYIERWYGRCPRRDRHGRPDPPAAKDRRVHQGDGDPAGLPTHRPRDRRGGGAHLILQRPQPAGEPATKGIAP